MVEVFLVKLMGFKQKHENVGFKFATSGFAVVNLGFKLATLAFKSATQPTALPLLPERVIGAFCEFDCKPVCEVVLFKSDEGEDAHA